MPLFKHPSPMTSLLDLGLGWGTQGVPVAGCSIDIRLAQRRTHALGYFIEFLFFFFLKCVPVAMLLELASRRFQ